MDPTRAIWHNDAVRAAVESGDLGAGTGRVRAAGQGAGRRVHRARHRGQEIAVACGQLAAEG